MKFKKLNWGDHQYLKKYDCYSYSHQAYEILKNHYYNYKYVITEVCLVDCSVSVFNNCTVCQAKIKKMIDSGEWNQKELEIVLADCERFLYQRYKKAENEKTRVPEQFVPHIFSCGTRINGSRLHKPLYYKLDN